MLFRQIDSTCRQSDYRTLSQISIESRSASHAAEDASEGIRQSPRGERLMLPTFGPSGIQERLNC